MRLRRALPLVLLALAPALSSPDAANRVVLYDLSIAVDTRLVVGSRASVAARVTSSRDLNHREPVAGARVVAELVELDGRRRARGVLLGLGSATTSKDGRAIINFHAPSVTTASVAIRVRTSPGSDRREVVKPVTIDENVVLHVRTDRGVYRPGSDFRWRATAVHGINSHPIGNLAVSVVVSGPKGPIWRGALRTDAAGMVAGSVPLANDARFGRYSVRVSAPARQASGDATAWVKRIVLPAYLVTIESTPSDPQPGQQVTATVAARYPHGEPVAGTVDISATVDDIRLVDKEKVRLDRFGKATVRFKPPIGRQGVVRASVTDGAKRRLSAEKIINLPGSRLSVAVIPEAEQLSPGRRNVHVITTDGRGELVASEVRLEWTGAEARTVVRSSGAITIPIDVREGLSRVRLSASATTADGRVAVAERTAWIAESNEVTRLAKSIVAAGDPVELRVEWPRRRGPVIATLLRHGAPLTSGLVSFSSETSSVGSASLSVPTGSFGLATVRLTELRFNKLTGAIEPRTSGKSVYLRRRHLNVAIDSKVRHQPGKTARAEVKVRHASGAPAVGIGLAASVVDERVLALSKQPLDLARVLDNLGTGGHRYRRGAADKAGLIFADLLSTRASTANATAMAAILDAVPPDIATPTVYLSEALRVASEAERIARADRAVSEAIFKGSSSFGRRVPGAGVSWVFAKSLDSVLEGQGWNVAERLDPWKRATSWPYARELNNTIAFERYADEAADKKLDALVAILSKRKLIATWQRRKKAPSSLTTLRFVPGHLRVDPWGGDIAIVLTAGYLSLTSAGPDQKRATDDDRQRVFFPGGIGVGGYGSSGYGSGGGGARGSMVPSVRIGMAQSSGGDRTTIRKRFDETVLWKTGIVTDKLGVATINVPLADSITGWQFDIEAVGPSGAVGVARSRLETHKARYVEAAMPAGLSVGDTFQLPLVVANHTDKPTEVVLSVKSRGAIKVAGNRAPSETLAKHSTRAFAIDLSAVEPGEGILTVTMRIAGRQIDAFERRLEVEHPGAIVRRDVATLLSNGSGNVSFAMQGAAKGTSRAKLRVFRGTLDRAIDGLDTMVNKPYGCFEQTSSATYPNILIARMLKSGAGKGRPELLGRARRFIAQGYQRLISYEVLGGGFSWFGSAPANQVLTAFGLMEFVDMETVYPVDRAMVDRTRTWLLKKQRADGSWRETKGTLGGKSQLATTAYVAWALAESGYRGRELRRALAYLAARRHKIAKSPYVLSLWAAAEATATGKLGPAGRALTKSLVTIGDARRIEDADAGGHVLFYGYGAAADAQATSLAAMALERAGKRVEAARARRWLLGAGAASWKRSTQGTVLALRSMTMAPSASDAAAGVVTVMVNGQRAGSIDLGSDELAGLPLGRFLNSGDNNIEVRGDAQIKGLLSASLESSWRTPGAEKASSAGLTIARSVDRSTVKRGKTINVSVKVANPGEYTVAMPMVIVPIPPGFRLAANRLPAAGGLIGKVEELGGELRVYLTELGGGRDISFHYSLVAENVASVLHRPASAYAYYQPTVRGTTGASRLIVTP